MTVFKKNTFDARISAIGMLIMFGSDLLVLYGTIAGLVTGGIISLLVKYSIDASIGRKTFFQII